MYVESKKIPKDELYKLLIGSVLPRPIAWIGSLSKNEIPNLAPFSFYTVASVNPPIICISILNKEGGLKKDSLVNIEETRCFSVSVVSHSVAKQMSITSGEYAENVNEFELAGLTPIPCKKIKSVRCAESQVSYECTLREVISFGCNQQAGNLVLADVVSIHIDDYVIDEDKINLEKIDLIGRVSGSYYSTTRDIFKIEDK